MNDLNPLGGVGLDSGQNTRTLEPAGQRTPILRPANLQFSHCIELRQPNESKIYIINKNQFNVPIGGTKRQ